MFSRSWYITSLCGVLVIGLFFLVGCASETEIPLSTLPPTLTPGSAETSISEIVEPSNTPEPTVQIEPTDVPEVEATPTQEPTSEGVTPEAQPTSTPTQDEGENETVSIDCSEKMAFFADVTVPDGTMFDQGESFTKTWRFRNEGTCTWTSDYAIIFHSGDIMSAPIEVPFPGTTEPGELADISVEMKAPTRGGQHISNWEFKNQAGEKFGAGISKQDLIWALINVRFLDQNDQPQPDPSTLPPPSAPPGCNVQQNSNNESQVVTLINQLRSQNELDALTVIPELTASALAHSVDMACNDFVGHVGSDGSHWTDRISVQGYSAGYSTENIYVGFPDFGGTPQGAFDWWINSQIHRGNILDSKVTEIGVGYVFAENSSFGGYYTINFATP